MTVKSPSERDGDEGALEILEAAALSADDGGNRTRAVPVLLLEDNVFVFGLENPLLLLLLVGLESLDMEEELAVEGGVGRYLTPVVEEEDKLSVPE